MSEEHCQGLTAREGVAHPGQAHEGTHNLLQKGEEIGAEVNQSCPVLPLPEYTIPPNKKETMNSNISQPTQLIHKYLAQIYAFTLDVAEVIALDYFGLQESSIESQANSTRLCLTLWPMPTHRSMMFTTFP